MKKLLTLIIFNLFVQTVRAQTYNEVFQQEKTQKKYLIQQIAALKIYLKAVEKGYSIAKEGLTTIGAIKDGDFNIHSEYFTSLEIVNPEISNHGYNQSIVSLQAQITEAYNHFYVQVENSGVFSDVEIAYVHRVYERLLYDCSQVVNELLAITSSARLEMKDDERLTRMRGIYQDMQDMYTFARDFGNGALLMAASRIQEQNNIENIRVLGDISTN